jgi:hypothetical protein
MDSLEEKLHAETNGFNRPTECKPTDFKTNSKTPPNDSGALSKDYGMMISLVMNYYMFLAVMD